MPSRPALSAREYTVPRVTLGVPTGSLDVSRWVGQRSQLRSPRDRLAPES